jgi:hypothetical protein
MGRPWLIKSCCSMEEKKEYVHCGYKRENTNMHGKYFYGTHYKDVMKYLQSVTLLFNMIHPVVLYQYIIIHIRQ